MIDWFQLGGNTYIVEAINTTASAASHPALAATDEVIKITGLVSLSGESSGGAYADALAIERSSPARIDATFTAPFPWRINAWRRRVDRTRAAEMRAIADTYGRRWQQGIKANVLRMAVDYDKRAACAIARTSGEAA